MNQLKILIIINLKNMSKIKSKLIKYVHRIKIHKTIKIISMTYCLTKDLLLRYQRKYRNINILIYTAYNSKVKMSHIKMIYG